MPAPVEHPILDRILIQLKAIHDMSIQECVAGPMYRDIVQGSESIEFTDDNGDWEIVVRPIEGGRD